MKLDNLLEKEYQNIHNKEISKISHTDNSSAIIELYEKFVENENIKNNTHDAYLLAKKMIEDFSCTYTIEDITLASFAIIEDITSNIVDNYTGIFLTSLIQVHYDRNQTKDSYLLITDPNKRVLHTFGYELNGPSIQIQGSIGFYLGLRLQSGLITVFGNVSSECGTQMKGGTICLKGDIFGSIGHGMENGTIIVSKNADEYVGTKMRGGTIIVKENAQNFVGNEMQGGKIHIYGNAKNFIGRQMRGGEIIIDGSCNDHIGYKMYQGIIHIKKNAGKNIGEEMYEGEIHVDGEIEGAFPYICQNGKIFQKGKQVHPKKIKKS